MVVESPDKVQIPELSDYIAGEFVAPEMDMGVWVHNPSTAERIQPQLATSEATLERALKTAQAVHETRTWLAVPPNERADLLDKVADVLETRVPELAMVEALNTGIVLNLNMMLNAITHLAFRAAAEMLRTGWTDSTLPGPHGDVEVMRRPWGVAVCIVPWNSPAPLAAHKVANALAAGCATILKPSEWAPYSSRFIAEAIAEVGLPEGVFQIVNGGAEVGSKLVSDPRVRAVSFTGGLQGGRAVSAACAIDFKPVQLELGGNNALVVLDDADTDAVAQGIVDGMTTLNGQWCRALGRLLVHENRQDEILEAALAKLAEVQIGDAASPDSQMGPLVHEGHLERVQASLGSLLDKGGQAHSSTPLPNGGGYFFAPTLVTGIDPADSLEEIFGPVAVVHSFSTDAEAVELANQTPYGLGGYVFGKDEERAIAVGRQMETGGVKINGVQLIGLHPMAPRPAWGLSGFGIEGTEETFQFFCGTRVVGVAARN